MARQDRNHTSDDGGENDDDQTNDPWETTLSLQEVAVVVSVIIFILISLLIFLEYIARRLKFQRDAEKDRQQQPQQQCQLRQELFFEHDDDDLYSTGSSSRRSRRSHKNKSVQALLSPLLSESINEGMYDSSQEQIQLSSQ
eukprot:CAMPEP_0171304158 /NCGR_PEP_ID=MMETSP0816-20121228/13850_1 /TAXON_ID=420281 /ORGANISM="Proboscia inermis, Strain CCAP1064/1" /LENGTH=140 /DNA_ID=CAMNT_0011784029 /DNA_START=149 /DNA_END=571 /DNA_ORIENTATION=+